MASACFDCNICLEFVHEPVVTLCGHLYCWPCIYKWFQYFQSTSLSSYDHPQCPVCKSPISLSTLVPLYGRSEPGSGSTPKSNIPPRPQACGTVMTCPRAQVQRVLHRDPYQSSGFYEDDSRPAVFGRRVSGGMGTDGIQYGMLGEILYARVFGNSDSLYAYPNTYGLGGSSSSSSSRLRWQEMQADKCLNRISVFLMCCFLLCLVLF